VRVRLLYPGFFKNEHLASLPFEARLLYEGLWLLADREGRLEDRPPRLKVELFPYDDVDVHGLLQQLDRAGFIRRYEVEGWRCIWLPTFLSHQRPHVREQASRLPDPRAACTHQGATNGHCQGQAAAPDLDPTVCPPDPDLDPDRDPDPGRDPDPVSDPDLDPHPDRAVARETSIRAHVTARALTIVRQALAYTTDQASSEEILDTILWHARQRGLPMTPTQAQDALALVRTKGVSR